VDSGSSDHRLQALACRTTFSSLTTTQSQLAALSPGSGFASGPESYASPKKPRSAEKALPAAAVAASSAVRKDKKHHKRKSDESDTLRIKLDGSFNNTTTYSIRSPMYPQRSEESAHEDDEDDEDDSSADESESSDDAHSPTVSSE
jgi:hypothetical protein